MNYLSLKQIKKYHKDGFLIVRNVFTKKECHELKKTLIKEIDKGTNILKKSLIRSEKKIDKNKIADIPRGVNEGYLQDIAQL